MSYYQAQAGWTDVIFGGAAGLFGGGGGPSHFVGRTIQLEVMRNQISQAWPTARTEYTVEQAVSVTRAVSDALSELSRQISKLVGRDLSLAGMHGLATHEMQSYAQTVGPCISNAKKAGSKIAHCPTLRAATIKALSNIVSHYETLAKKEHELDTSILQRVEEAFAFVGEWIVAIANNLPVPKMPDFGGIADLVKWLTLAGVGGGLIYFIWQQEKKR